VTKEDFDQSFKWSGTEVVVGLIGSIWSGELGSRITHSNAGEQRLLLDLWDPYGAKNWDFDHSFNCSGAEVDFGFMGSIWSEELGSRITHSSAGEQKLLLDLWDRYGAKNWDFDHSFKCSGIELVNESRCYHAETSAGHPNTIVHSYTIPRIVHLCSVDLANQPKANWTAHVRCVRIPLSCAGSPWLTFLGRTYQFYPDCANPI
jgi:hypothetical protein